MTVLNRNVKAWVKTRYILKKKKGTILQEKFRYSKDNAFNTMTITKIKTAPD